MYRIAASLVTTNIPLVFRSPSSRVHSDEANRPRGSAQIRFAEAPENDKALEEEEDRLETPCACLPVVPLVSRVLPLTSREFAVILFARELRANEISRRPVGDVVVPRVISRRRRLRETRARQTLFPRVHLSRGIQRECPRG